eukprot:757477-Rhodomonas_salina.1
MSVVLQDDGGTADGGEDESEGPPRNFSVLVRPSPQVLPSAAIVSLCALLTMPGVEMACGVAVRCA